MDGEDVDLVGIRGDQGASTPAAASPAELGGGTPDSPLHATTAPQGSGYRLAAVGACVALAVAIVVAVALEPAPGRHMRGLLLVVALVLAVGVSSAWLWVVRALRA